MFWDEGSRSAEYRLMPLLSDERISLVITTAKALGLADSRNTLFSDIQATKRKLGTSTVPTEQLILDLNGLNALPPKDPSKRCPLECWLVNAILLHEEDPHCDVLREALKEAEEARKQASPAPSSKHIPPPRSRRKILGIVVLVVAVGGVCLLAYLRWFSQPPPSALGPLCNGEPCVVPKKPAPVPTPSASPAAPLASSSSIAPPPAAPPSPTPTGPSQYTCADAVELIMAPSRSAACGSPPPGLQPRAYDGKLAWSFPPRLDAGLERWTCTCKAKPKK